MNRTASLSRLPALNDHLLRPLRRPEMEVQLEKSTTHDDKRLQRCINDLSSVLALPAMWIGSEPSHIVSTLLDALVGMLSLDLVFARLNEPASPYPLERVRFAGGVEGETPEAREIGTTINKWLADSRKNPYRATRKAFGEADISILPLRLGIDTEIGFIVAGSRREDFPEDTEKLVLSVAANQAAIALQEWRLRNEQKRIATELDERVAQRTKEIAEVNAQLRTEIAARISVEKKVRQSELDLRRMTETIPAMLWSATPDGAIDYCNSRVLEYTGAPAEEIVGEGWKKLIHTLDLEPTTRVWMSCIRTGTPYEVEVRAFHAADNTYRWCLTRALPLFDQEGQIVKWHGTIVDMEDWKQSLEKLRRSEDITEGKLAEEKLRRSEAFLAEAQHLSRIGSFAWRVAAQEINWSDQLYRIFEFDRKEPVTLDRIATRVHPEDLPLLADMIERASCGASDFEYEHRLLMPDQSIKYLHLIAHGTRDYDGKFEYIGAVQDVTQRRCSEEALANVRSELAKVVRVNSLALLTAAVAHEVNQPLSGIVTNAGTCLRMLASDPPNVDGARETARRTIRDGNRASEVITRLRRLFSKKEAKAESVDLNDAAKEVIALSWSDLQRSRVFLRRELEDDLPRVNGDRVQLQQVILNLLRNASDAMSTVYDRPRELSIRTEREGRDRVRLSARDSGIGFETNTAEKLFEAFYTTKVDGMGIGLSISRSIIEAHRGRLWATPNDGPGATFSFSIPCGNV